MGQYRISVDTKITLWLFLAPPTPRPFAGRGVVDSIAFLVYMYLISSFILKVDTLFYVNLGVGKNLGFLSWYNLGLNILQDFLIKINFDIAIT
jgi:hypothetical protein